MPKRSGRVAEKRPDNACFLEALKLRPELGFLEPAAAYHPFTGAIQHPQIEGQGPHTEILPRLATDGEVHWLQDTVVAGRGRLGHWQSARTPKQYRTELNAQCRARRAC